LQCLLLWFTADFEGLVFKHSCIEGPGNPANGPDLGPVLLRHSSFVLTAAGFVGTAKSWEEHEDAADFKAVNREALKE
jgi:hypothetical protein